MSLKSSIILNTIISLSMISSSFAADLTAAPKATATLTSSCTVSASPINFGELAIPSTGTIQWQADSFLGNLGITCSNKLAFNIDLGNGLNGNITVGRNMSGNTSGALAHYAICQTNVLNISSPTSAGCGKPWWTKSASYGLASTGTGILQNIPVYGFIQKAYYTPDNYSDTVIATLTY